ncbi:hypothetical protein DUI87_35317 [Hirundo rustica rustica]|uniref:Maestro/Maestro-like HEAT-repeats domain-containing protein n=1 Tax=Hirundo rustica rustica TaxID=333673 RepID=A0A3M0IHQ8_HIRRU|nr:hypothetical protein DUI87_35317 [Hirundo rustica rustica]
MISVQDEDQKLKFLDSVCTLCRTAKDDGFSQDLDDFCCRYKLGEMIQTLHAMDTMLEVMMLSSPALVASEMLQDILEELLDYMDTVAVQERVMGRVRLLSHLLADPSTVQAFGRYLRRAERTGIVLTTIEILGCSSLLDKQVPVEFLEVAMKSPGLWLMDGSGLWLPLSPVRFLPPFLPKPVAGIPQSVLEVPKVMRHIFVYCDEKNTTTAHSFPTLLVLMMLASGDVLENKVCPLDKSLNLLRSPRKAVVPLVLRALVTLSERVETARKMKSLLPELVEFLWHWSWDISVMAMDTCHKVLEQLKKSEASAIAVQMVQRLWHLFDEEDCVQERSICLFRELLGKMVWRDTKAMRRNSWEALVRFVLHMSDQAPSVAKASKEAILATAELLKWRELKHLAQREQTWRMGECLLAKDSSRAEEFVSASQPYLLSPQVPVREAALRFIGWRRDTPRQPRVAWKEVVAPEESSSAAERPEVTMVQPLQPNAAWVTVYAQEAMDFIQ